MALMITAPRGTADILPDSSYKWRYVENIAKIVALRFGYEEIRTPMFEQTELFSRGIGSSTDIVRKEMYVFEDRKGRSMSLRPEGTATVMRSVIEHKMYANGLNKLFYIGPFFRYERPQAGRYRQFHQFGLEAIGSSQPAVDAEIMHAVLSFFYELKIRSLCISLNSLGCAACRPSYRKELVNYLQENKEELCADCKERIELNPLRVLDCKNPNCRQLLAQAPEMLDFLCEKCERHFNDLEKYLQAFKLPYIINPKIVRGLDYYTGTVFEVITDSLGSQDAICGGGRYDLLGCEVGGKEIPAVGVAIGLERTLALMEKLGCDFGERSKPTAYIVSMDETCEQFVSLILSLLRNNGISADRNYNGRNIKTQMKAAKESGAVYALIIGTEETKGSFVTVKNMESAEQTQVPFNEIIDYLSRRKL